MTHISIKFFYTTIIFLTYSFLTYAQFEPQNGMIKGQFDSKQFIINGCSNCVNNGLSTSTFCIKSASEKDIDYLTDNNWAGFLINYYQVTFGFWTLLGEPVCEYKFYWEYNKSYEFKHSYNGKDYLFTILKMEKYPDLIQRLKTITPLPDIKLDVCLSFYVDNIEYPVATCRHRVWIDLASPAFVKDNFSLPGSTDWDKMFTDVYIKDTPSAGAFTGGQKLERKYWGEMPKTSDGHVVVTDKKEFARNMQLLFKNTSRIELASHNGKVHLPPSFASLKWNYSEIKDIFDEYCRRETMSATKTQAVAENIMKVVEFEQWKNNLDKAEMLYQQRKWQEAREIYQEVSTTNPELNYPKSKVVKINKLLAYRPQQDSVTDLRDGKTYKIIQINHQTWIDDPITHKPNSGHWVFNNDPNNGIPMGYLYNWEAAKNVCPSGWHMPNEEEWKQLVDYLGEKNEPTNKMNNSNIWIDNGKNKYEYSGFHKSVRCLKNLADQQG